MFEGITINGVGITVGICVGKAILETMAPVRSGIKSPPNNNVIVCERKVYNYCCDSMPTNILIIILTNISPPTQTFIIFTPYLCIRFLLCPHLYLNKRSEKLEQPAMQRWWSPSSRIPPLTFVLMTPLLSRAPTSILLSRCGNGKQGC